MIVIENGSTKAVINPNGAWVEELSENGNQILFPHTQLVSDSGEHKDRGGMHVCLPNFGPGGNSQLAQHGFGRTSEWKVLKHNKNSVTLRLKTDMPHYGNMVSTLLYEVKDGSLSATLNLKNKGQVSVRVAPGFHPYFHLDESESAIEVNGIVYELADLGGTEFIESEKATLKTVGREINITQLGLSKWAIWTDMLANYVCVEPTFGGYRFLENSSPEEFIAPGKEKSFACTISF